MNIPLAPADASVQAASFDTLFLVLVVLSLLIVALVGMLILVFAIRFRSGSSAPRHRVPRLFSREIEIGWTAATAFVALFLFWFAAGTTLHQIKIPANAMEVHVEAKQWMWKTRQPNGVRELNALHVPTGQPVALYLNSQDVIHSFFVPAFRIKQDVVPGRTSTAWFEATKPGIYRLMCAEYCGTDHSGMRGEIVVMAPEDYARWLEAQPQGDTLAAEGRALFTAAGCSGCHAEASAVHAPRLAGIFGRDVPLADGRIVVADEAYLTDSILLPKRDVVAGYEPIMPNFARVLDAGEVAALVAYIRALGHEPPAAAKGSP